MTQKVKESGQGKHLGMLTVEEDAYCGMATVGEDRRNNIKRGIVMVLYSQWQEKSASERFKYSKKPHYFL